MGTLRPLTERLSAVVAALPPGSAVTLPCDALRAWIAEDGECRQAADDTPPPPAPAAVELSWRERLRIAPAETRIGLPELLEALGRSRSWVYKQTAAGSIPHRKLDGELVFVVGELRTWIREHETIVAAAPLECTWAERQRRA